MKRLSKYLWEIALRLKRGKVIVIKPTMRCNLNCPYCIVDKTLNTRPKFKEMPVMSWLKLIGEEIWNGKVKLLVISGGEPGLYKDLHAIVNYAVDNGILVQIISNITHLSEFDKIKDSWRVVFLSTYHPVGSLKRFMFGYKELSSRFYVTVRELRPKGDMNPRYISFAKTIPIKDEQSDKEMEIYAPDGTKYNSCLELDKAGH